MARLDYEGSSVLFAGDTVGRRKSDNNSACKDAEKIMVDRHDAGEVSLESDVMIAPHHGGNNGRCVRLRTRATTILYSLGDPSLPQQQGEPVSSS